MACAYHCRFVRLMATSVIDETVRRDASGSTQPSATTQPIATNQLNANTQPSVTTLPGVTTLQCVTNPSLRVLSA